MSQIDVVKNETRMSKVCFYFSLKKTLDTYFVTFNYVFLSVFQTLSSFFLNDGNVISKKRCRINRCPKFE